MPNLVVKRIRDLCLSEERVWHIWHEEPVRRRPRDLHAGCWIRFDGLRLGGGNGECREECHTPCGSHRTGSAAADWNDSKRRAPLRI